MFKVRKVTPQIFGIYREPLYKHFKENTTSHFNHDLQMEL